MVVIEVASTTKELECSIGLWRLKFTERDRERQRKAKRDRDRQFRLRINALAQSILH